jgi:hypothetical protein
MFYTERTDLAVGCSMTVQEQHIDDALITPGNRDARIVHNGDASHQGDTGQFALEGCGILGAEQFQRSAQVDDCRLEVPRPFLYQRNVGCQEQR